MDTFSLDPTWLIITVVSLMFSALFSGTEIAFITSDCPDHVCIKNGWLAREGEQAICLPNRVSVILTDGSTVPVELD